MGSKELERGRGYWTALRVIGKGGVGSEICS